MNFILTQHAKQRANERFISVKSIDEALRNPTKVLYDQKGRVLIKKLYIRRSKERLLLIFGEMTNNGLIIITIIETSKVKKYL